MQSVTNTEIRFEEVKVYSIVIISVWMYHQYRHFPYDRDVPAMQGCLIKNMANFWQNFFENSNIFSNIDFSLQNDNVLAILLSYFSILFNFLGLRIRLS